MSSMQVIKHLELKLWLFKRNDSVKHTHPRLSYLIYITKCTLIEEVCVYEILSVHMNSQCPFSSGWKMS